jgi:short subunit dehydrogenase-like uncharacterized protein
VLPYQVVVWGASGFTGRLVCPYLAEQYGIGGPLRWAIAGRNRPDPGATGQRFL